MTTTTTTRLKIEVFRSPGGIVTVTTDAGGIGTRLCGIKLHASGSVKVAEFWLDREAVDAIGRDFAEAKQRAKEGR